jgi:amino acid adenylation domain-containing protein
MFEAFMRFLGRLADDETAWGMSWAQLAPDIVPPAQRERTRALNAKTAPIPDALLQDLFAAQVPLRGDAPAVIDSRRTLSYRELDQLANQWARRLRDAGIEPGRNVAVVMDKGWEQIVAVMAILRAGCAYVPIDSRQPAGRRRYMLENSEAACALVQSWINDDRDWPAGLKRFQVDSEDSAATDATPLPQTRRPDDAAYVIYTSGSTGEPKGVVVAHRSVVNVVACTNQAFGVDHADRAFAVTVLHHDLSVYDVFGLLAAGGAIVLPDEASRRDPARWAELIQSHGVTIWNTVPAMMVMLLDYADSHPRAVPPTLRQVILGGDWVPVDVPRRLATHNPCTKLLCIGGPTETTIWNIWYRADNVHPDWKSIPYGQPMANNSYHILGETMVPRPDWVPGEQYCGGNGLALGYWRDPAKTADKFVRHPLTGERLYRTGDLGRWLPDGNIEFIGRADFQVKINGQRIELGEIEAAMRRHPAIRAAVVAMTERAEAGKRLAAYYVLQPGAKLESGELRAFLATVLPETMVPSFYLALERLPLTANGKIDRKSLPDPQPISSEVPAASAEAKDSMLGIVLRMIAGVLKLETVDSEANLLAIGANSIDMVRIGNELEKAFGFRPRMDQIFRLQTARAIAEYCEAQTGRKSAAKADATAPVEEDWCTVVASFGNLIEPEERDAFKESEPGIRRDDEDRPFVQLEPPVLDEALLARYRDRKSHRTFALKAVPLEQFGRMLSCLYQIRLDGKPKYLWPSPGGLYPVQVYLHVKAGRVSGLRAGTYYYHPVKHRLVGLTPDVEIDRSIHVPFVNTPVFDDAAFSIFLVSRLAAIAPSYGEASFAFARIEAGIIAVLLEDAARQCGLGLCQIGGIDFDRIRPLFSLERSHLFVHSLLGGLPAGEPKLNALGTASASARAAQLLARVSQLTPEEAKAMLEAMNNEGRS